ncbi:universal stress protein [Mangrovimonas spongiae]|uniref:UspA domain-containing protein n=1 Tax=Mangrovimonas spongiae TaxID=2494697 RepID=A0A428JX47_9FLAO|nr:universal stress protein [Mangrovimonas spongiae]RSK38675.1 hypothetical protein EJA19_11500 [Mangrovimonas spongiae]
MKNILLPTDFSQNSWEAIEYAINLFQDGECTFYLMHSYEPQVSAPSTAVTSKRANSVIMESIKNEATLGLQKVLKQINSLPLNENHTFKTIIANDYFTDAVETQVNELGIDAVILGTKGASGLKEITLGSNTANLIGKLSCPIIAVPTNVVLKDVKEIGFAVDFSIKSYDKGLDLLKDIATHYESKISVVHILNKHKELTAEMLSSKIELESYLKPVPTTFYNLTDVSVELGTRIFSESRQLDMMCVIAKKHGFFERLFNKSQSKSISHHAKVPLIIFNETDF